MIKEFIRIYLISAESAKVTGKIIPSPSILVKMIKS